MDCRLLARSTYLNATTSVRPGEEYHTEDMETAEALEQENFSYLYGDEGGWDEGAEGDVRGEENEEDDGITLRLGNLGKPVPLERWVNADTPMKVFVNNHRDETLDEMLRGDGRGSEEIWAQCAACKAEDPRFRCARQTCIGAAMYCESCIAELHRQLPTHMLEKWNGEFFVSLTLNELDIEARDFVIIDTLGVRVVKLSFCGCDSRIAHRQQLMRACLWPATSIDPQTCTTFNVIRLFEVQNCLGKISAYDFVRSLELLSNGDGLETVDRKGVPKPPPGPPGEGGATTTQGVRGTGQGELALPCRACPQPGVNLPPRWDQIDWAQMPEDQRYKYELKLSEDANFKLINRNVSTEARDPVVDDGTGYFTNRKDYSDHIRKHVDEQEISSCSGFQAMFLANSKRVKGLRVTGVGGVTCARHNMWRPNGFGDLQMGERYCNMDFLLFASLLGFVLTLLTVSYDIACQSSKHIWTRMQGLPQKYHLNIDPANVCWMIPNFHLPGHKIACHSPFSFHWLWGAGLTHGKTVEQNWEFLNGAAGSTKLMGVGARQTALEGLLGFHNWRRLIAHRRLLKQRMAEGIKGGRTHGESFKAFNEGLEASGEVDVEAWRGWVDKWERERHVEGEKGSPYEYEKEGMSLKEIRLMIAAEEYSRTGDGMEVEREDTPSTFVSMGMEIEETQRQLAVTIKAAGPNPTPTQQLDVLKRRLALRLRIQGFRKLQMTYMPKVRQYLSASQKAVWDADDQQPEATRLFLPSDLGSEASRVKACAAGLDGVEARMRTGEAGEALTQLCRGLRTRTMTNKFKIRNWSGQRALTRGQGILRQINIRIHAAKLRYRYARQALLKLKGHGEWETQFWVLQDDDVRALNDRSLREEEQAQDEQLGALGVADGLPAIGAVVAGEGHRTLSWIWYVHSTTAEGDAKLHEALRVEWCKAYSRANRWREELVLLEEEM
ncbi:hypothetical protein B0H14DRAFT_3482945 [Mycena olivaceomarginata]|nr:hypothetical protein B0H14DRAFT_3482945 [Mycena olivaceomarginata]